MPTSQQSNPGRATALTTGQQVKSTPSTAKQVFHSSNLNSDHSEIKTVNLPKQSIQVSSSSKSRPNEGQKTNKTMKVTLSTRGTNRPISSHQPNISSQSQEPISRSVTKTSSVPCKDQSQGSSDNAVKSGVDIDTPDERKSPKIKTGAISAMSKFWEKRLTEGAGDDAPEILEYE